jgi:hypothetical protein
MSGLDSSLLAVWKVSSVIRTGARVAEVPSSPLDATSPAQMSEAEIELASNKVSPANSKGVLSVNVPWVAGEPRIVVFPSTTSSSRCVRSRPNPGELDPKQ